jgi:NADH dehydrogenase/NADH:ubiquinone oxidoreductase subunit G
MRSPGFEREGLPGAVPAGDHQWPLVVRVDEPHEIAEHDAVLMAQSRARQDYCCEPGVIKMNGKAGGNEFRASGSERQWRIVTGAQIQAGRAVGGVSGQREFDSPAAHRESAP